MHDQPQPALDSAVEPRQRQRIPVLADEDEPKRVVDVPHERVPRLPDADDPPRYHRPNLTAAEKDRLDDPSVVYAANVLERLLRAGDEERAHKLLTSLVDSIDWSFRDMTTVFKVFRELVLVHFDTDFIVELASHEITEHNTDVEAKRIDDEASKKSVTSEAA